MEVLRIRVRKQKIPTEPPKQKGLLDVLLPKIRVCRLTRPTQDEQTRTDVREEDNAHLYDVKQFSNDSGNAPKERRPALAFHLMAVPFHLDEGAFLRFGVLADAGWVHFRDRRQEHCGCLSHGRELRGRQV